MAVMLLATACGDPPPPSIVLVSIDTLRADALGCYGAERDTSLAIDALAAEGTRFEVAVAPTSWTLPSHVTLLTGLSILGHRVDHPTRRIDDARQLLADHLRQQGYRTAAFVSAPFLHRAYGFDRGFEVYENFQGLHLLDLPPVREAHDRSNQDETAPEVVDAAVAWLAEQPLDGPPWFLFVHLWDVHNDYLPPAPYDRLFDPDYAGDLDPRQLKSNDTISKDMPARDLVHLRALYDGEVRWADANLARLFDALREREPDERVVLALVSDHGEEFFEHGEKGHQNNLHETSVRVPWIVRAPGVPAGATLGGVAGLEDVAPTLLGLAGLPPLPEATGRNLAEHVRKGTPVPGAVLMTLNQVNALRGPDWKVVKDGSSRLAFYYDLARDPEEKHPQMAEPDKLQLIHDRLRAARDHARALAWAGDTAVSLDAETEERLRALGYVGRLEMLRESVREEGPARN